MGVLKVLETSYSFKLEIGDTGKKSKTSGVEKTQLKNPKVNNQGT